MKDAAKYVLIGIAPLALGFGVWRFLSTNKSPIPSSRAFVDVTTGEIVDLSTKKVKTIPAKNEAGEFALLPVGKGESGAWVVLERYRPALERFKDDARLKIDMSTFEVKQ